MSLPPIHILFGTVTGNAEEIARRIHSELLTHSLPQGNLLCLADYEKLPCFQIDGQHSTVVIVVSTTGSGDPPETIRPFMRLLRKKEPHFLANLSFTVLGLGDTNYENFCATGKRVDRALSKLGAQRFYNRGDADDGVGLELVVEPWIEGLWKVLKSMVEKEQNHGQKTLESGPDAALRSDEQGLGDVVKAITVQELGFEEAKLPKVYPPKLVVSAVDNISSAFEPPLSVSQSYSAEYVRRAHITAAKLLTTADADKEVWHMELTCEGEDTIQRTYCPGDAFGIIVENNPDEVMRFMRSIGVEGDTILKVQKVGGFVETASIAQFVAQFVDLRATPKKALLRCMSDYCSNVEERKALLRLCSKDGRKEYSEQLVAKNMSIVQVLEEKARSCRAPISLFLNQLPPLAPRWYSATSSPELDGSAVLQFAFSVVANGLATNALAKDCRKFLRDAHTKGVLLIPRESDGSSHFRPPKSLSTSYIMVGPGTGVAPFRGFLRERAARLKKETSSDNGIGKTMLFFGCRHKDKDFLYHDDLSELETSEVLTTLDIAFSRMGPEKVYVQDRLERRAEEVADVIKNGGNFYVCGDGGGMAQGVHAAFAKILIERCCDGNTEEGKVLLQQLIEDHRYVRDIWYHG